MCVLDRVRVEGVFDAHVIRSSTLEGAKPTPQELSLVSQAPPFFCCIKRSTSSRERRLIVTVKGDAQLLRRCVAHGVRISRPLTLDDLYIGGGLSESYQRRHQKLHNRDLFVLKETGARKCRLDYEQFPLAPGRLFKASPGSADRPLCVVPRSGNNLSRDDTCRVSNPSCVWKDDRCSGNIDYGLQRI